MPFSSLNQTLLPLMRSHLFSWIPKRWPSVSLWQAGTITALLLTLRAGAIASQTETVVKGRRSLVLDGEAAQLVVDLAGGSIADFHFRSQGLNPLQWE